MTGHGKSSRFRNGAIHSCSQVPTLLRTRPHLFGHLLDNQPRSKCPPHNPNKKTHHPNEQIAIFVSIWAGPYPKDAIRMLGGGERGAVFLNKTASRLQSIIDSIRHLYEHGIKPPPPPAYSPLYMEKTFLVKATRVLKIAKGAEKRRARGDMYVYVISAGFPMCLFIRNSVKVGSFRISWILINGYYCFLPLSLSLPTFSLG